VAVSEAKGRYTAVSEVQRPKFNGYIFNRHSPTDASARSGVTVMQRPWPLAKANGIILVLECLSGIISVRLLRSCVSRWPPLNDGDWHNTTIARPAVGYFEAKFEPLLLLDQGGGFTSGTPYGGFRSEMAVTKPFRK
jgi:hypothetical protein